MGIEYNDAEAAEKMLFQVKGNMNLHDLSRIEFGSEVVFISWPPDSPAPDIGGYLWSPDVWKATRDAGIEAGFTMDDRYSMVALIVPPIHADRIADSILDEHGYSRAEDGDEYEKVREMLLAAITKARLVDG